MLHPTKAERGKREGPTARYELLLAKGYHHTHGLQESVASKLRLFTLVKREELRGALERRLTLTAELLEATAHNLQRSEALHRRVLADWKRLLELLGLLEDENRGLHHRLSRKGRENGPT